jgi:hypothetical protein
VCEKATKYRRYGLQTTCDNDGDCPRPSAIPTDFNFLSVYYFVLKFANIQQSNNLYLYQSRSQSMPVRGLCCGMTLGKSNRNRDLIGCRDHQCCRHINACFMRELRGNIREERIIKYIHLISATFWKDPLGNLLFFAEPPRKFSIFLKPFGNTS